MMRKQTIGLCTAILLTGCIFSEEKPLIGSDTAVNVSPGDMQSPDDLNEAADSASNNVQPDLSSPDDGAIDQGPTDAGTDQGGVQPDMAPTEQPWMVVSSHDIALGGNASVISPTEVAGMSAGFLLGYTEQLTDSAVFGWYSSDSATPIDTAILPGADRLSLDVSGTTEGGFGVFIGTNDFYGVWFDADVAA